MFPDTYNLKSISVGNDVVYSFEYDNFNDDVSKIKIGSMTLIEHLYAANNGRLLRSDYGNGTYTEKVYKNDWSNTVTGVKYNGTEAYQYAYDNTNTVGIHTDNENGDTYHYEYDERGRLIGVVSSEDYNTRMTFTEYDEPLRSEINVQVSGAYAEKYGKNKTWYTEISYNNKRQVSTANFGYGKKNYSYDALGRTTGAAIRDNCNSSSDILTESVVYNTNADGTTSTQVGSYTMAGTTYGYTYDSNGNILTISKNGALAESYVYDGLNQLVRENSVTQNKTVVYEYDNRGNITSKKTYAYTAGEITGTPTDEVVYSYNNSQWKDMLTAYDGENITYDGIGNPITYRNGISFTWKNGRRLASYTDGVYNITYNYTDGGIRKNKTVNGETTEYLLSGSQIMQERRPNGDILNYARDESGGLVGFDYYSAAENVINFYYYLKNMQGDIVGITDRQGNVLVTYTYDTWGKLISITGSMANTIGIINPFRYRGYYYDTETGLYYVSSRYYDPEIGRWINEDSGIAGVGGSIQGYNMFAYCFNNPVNMSDPTGNWPKWITVVARVATTTIINSVVTPLVISVAPSATVLTASAVLNTVSVPVAAAMPSKEDHYNRNQNNIQFPEEYDEAFFKEWDDSVSANCHQFSAPNRDNIKYVSPDGKYEAIYDASNKIVTDPRDIGTYNFVSPNKDPFGHFIKDVIPWIQYGNSPDDSTEWWQRSLSFIGIYE